MKLKLIFLLFIGVYGCNNSWETVPLNQTEQHQTKLERISQAEKQKADYEHMQKEEQVRADFERNQRTAQKETIVATLNNSDQRLSPDQLLKLCEPVTVWEELKQNVDVVDACSKSYLAMADAALKTKDLTTVSMCLGQIKLITASPPPQLASIERQYRHLRTLERAKEAERTAPERARESITAFAGLSEEEFQKCVEVKGFVVKVAEAADRGASREEILKIVHNKPAAVAYVNLVYDFRGALSNQDIAARAMSDCIKELSK